VKVENNFSGILTEKALLHPEKVFCHKINGRSITFQELEHFVNRCCFLFEEIGVGAGDILTISIPNSISFIVLYFAGIRSGIKVNPCPATLSENELINNINFVGSKFLITQKLIDVERLPDNCSYLMFNDDKDFLLKLDTYNNQKFDHKIRSDDIACIYYSSGTTGESKCVLYSNKNMLSLIKSIVNEFELLPDSVHLGVLPLGHTAITNYQLLPSLYAGSTLFLAENFNSVRGDIWKIIADFKITYFQVVPTILFAMMATPYDDEDVKSNCSLQYIGCGSAPLSTESQINFYNRFNVKVANLYGLSETGPSHFDNPLLPDWKPGSIGYPLKVNDCKIFNKDLDELGTGAIGQIGLKGENIFVGYYKNEKAYKNSFFNDYFLTGDLGYKDDTGKYYFADREKDLIIKAGVNIVPGEIEEIIFQLRDVKSVAVIGVPHKLFGEEIVAFVETKNRSLEESHIQDVLAENLQPLKRPNRIIFIENMPLGPSGKILKRKLLC
jgi:acyl-coenzyme A synthetase/AMP-(fatty) acid ligase